jgi:multiple sugar transport system ATP-binding protein
VEPLGVETLLHIKIGEQTIVCTVPGISGVRRGDTVRFNVVRERLHFFDWARGTRL